MIDIIWLCSTSHRPKNIALFCVAVAVAFVVLLVASLSDLASALFSSSTLGTEAESKDGRRNLVPGSFQTKPLYIPRFFLLSSRLCDIHSFHFHLSQVLASVTPRAVPTNSLPIYQPSIHSFPHPTHLSDMRTLLLDTLAPMSYLLRPPLPLSESLQT